ncbi:NUDIX hydrolase [Clostridium isatidis]|uniref:DNA mismatch repair protein MutT n=1 Tax=Clostridium isatidis TaxID=182773 RepID=A0A343JD69_9CLOT|nr:NUDIX hydrolase [Clostridium isatidis]ASW43477.1 DNA mismatch repair protein MutT [Clostridium isatidis]NLZ33786.1 NUDIX hydrolase [Clostridiales bacterium]
MGKITKINTLAQTKFLNLYEAEYINKLGENKKWTIASRKNKQEIDDKFFQGKKDKIDAVVIIPRHIEENKLVIIKQFRVPLNDFVIELPAGLIDGNETFEEAVKRELKEETGLDLVNIDYNKTIEKTYASVGMTDESFALVSCNCKGKVSLENLEADEEIEVKLITKEEGREILKSGQKIDVKAYLAISNFINS